MGASASAPADGLARTPTARRSGFRLANGDGASSSAPPNPSSSSASLADPADYDFIAECLLSLLLFSGPHGRAAAAAAARSTYVVRLKAGDILAREGDSSPSGGDDGGGPPPRLAPSASSGALASLASSLASFAGASSSAPAPHFNYSASTEIYIVKSGTLEVIESRGGSAMRVDLKRRGDCVGEVREKERRREGGEKEREGLFRFFCLFFSFPLHFSPRTPFPPTY